ncbi:MAG: YHS domain-containing (seleno)protein [Gammaproteobacteria bacterium]|jgi:YHS domain-containing protein
MRSLKFCILALTIMLSACTSIASKPTFKTEAGAIRGYDPVAYFTEERPVLGSDKYNYQYDGATWYFSSKENMQLFENNPEKYAPQYGGYCAYGMAKGFVVSTDPEAFSLADGKLYLNYSLGVRKTWLKDVSGNIEKADKNWIEKQSLK